MTVTFRCVACGAEVGLLETHTAHDCARRLRVVRFPHGLVVAPLRKDWEAFRAA